MVLIFDRPIKSLEAVLLHNGNKLPSLPFAHFVHLKQNYESVNILFEALKHHEYKWHFIENFENYRMEMQNIYVSFVSGILEQMLRHMLDYHG